MAAAYTAAITADAVSALLLVHLPHQAVSTLFTTTDAIELQRAMFLIRRLDCKISTRLYSTP